MSWQLLRGDCRKLLAQLPDASVDAVVTDPPYELGFMGKAWDASGVAYDLATWSAVLRVLKPGGHLLAFGGTRTYHRLACAVEDAGFEIRDSIHWLYGSGFPKSLDVSKAIDKQRHDRAEVYEVTAWVRQARDAAGITNRDIDAAFGFSGMAGHWTSGASQPAVPTLEQVPVLLDLFGMSLDEVPEDVRRVLWDLNGRKGQPGENWARREVVGPTRRGAQSVATNAYGAWGDGITPTAAATPEAEQWQGWGTALKPAHEPIVVARKPLVGTVAANVLAHGTGALNIDGCRVAAGDNPLRWSVPRDMGYGGGTATATATATTDDRGRWPANVVLDGEVATELDRQSGHDDSGGASRFFFRADLTDDDLTSFRYVAKPDRAERDAGLGDLEPVHRANGNKWTDQDYRVARGERPPSAESGPRQNFHPTVKPLDLMRWLVRLVTPPGGVVLDPFAGSGTTLAAALLEGVDCIGIELTDDYVPIIEGRCQWAERQARFGPVQGPSKPKPTDTEPTLFDQ